MIRDWSDLPLVLLQEHVCRIFVFSPRTLRRKITLGRMLPPLNPDEKQKRWNRDLVRRWIDDGCPPPSEWQ